MVKCNVLVQISCTSIGITLFAAVGITLKQLEYRFSQLFLAHQLALCHLMVMQASFQDHRKFLSDNGGCY